MTLSPIMKSDDPHFNQKAAQAAYEMVAKIAETDEGAAREFMAVVTADILEDTIEKNLPTLQRHLDRVIKKRIDRVKKAVVAKAARGEVDQDALAFSQALGEISKWTNPYDNGYRFEESDFRRDPGSGRFRTKITVNENAPKLKRKQQEALGIPEHDKYKKMSTEDKVRYQQEYLQLANFLNSVNASTTGNKGDVQTVLHLKDKAGRSYATPTFGTKPKNAWDPTTERLVGVEAKPGALTYGGAAFGLTQALGGGQGAAQGAGRSMAYSTDGGGINTFSEDWLKGTDPRNSNERLYNRVAAGSNFLNNLAGDGSTLQMAAKFGQFVGSYGPQAEKVLGPSARKTAYRYRGTERKADPKLIQRYGTAVMRAKTYNSMDPYRNTPEGRRANLKQPAPLSMTQQALARVTNERRAPSWTEREPGRQEIVEYLKESPKNDGVAPSKGLYNLQLASGNTPPSEGVMLNKDGQIVAQAVGYGDDHYLPFNLKNLKELKGGEYIRNRSVGGLTSEDIYTGLIAGARRVTVTSRSGTFTMEFQEDFRGGRRHNDKARRMVRRYEQILDAVQSNQVERKDVDPQVRAAITQEVKDESGAYFDRAEIRAEVTRRIDEYKSDPDIGEEEERIAEIIIAARTNNGTSRDAKEIRESVLTDIASDKEYKFRLNGEGYKAALYALREQFPYYINVTTQVAKPQHTIETELDSGYVEPGRNRPTHARSGLYGTSVNPGKKFSASHADYQGFNVKARGGTEDGTEIESKTESTDRTTSIKESGRKIEQKLAAAKQQAAYTPAAVTLQQSIVGSASASPPNAPAWWSMSEAEFSTALKSDPETVKSFNNFVAANESTISGVTSNQTPLAQFKLASGHINRPAYDVSLAEEWMSKPFDFDSEGPGFAPGSSADDRDRALKQIRAYKTSGMVNDKPLALMTTNELEQEVLAVGEVRRTMKDIGTELNFAQRRALLKGLTGNAETIKRVSKNTDAMGAYLTAVHMTRAVNQDVPDTERGIDPTVVVRNEYDPANVENIRTEQQKKMTRWMDNVAEARRWAEDNGDDNLQVQLSDLEKQMEKALPDINDEASYDAWFDYNKKKLTKVQVLVGAIHNRGGNPPVEGSSGHPILRV